MEGIGDVEDGTEVPGEDTETDPAPPGLMELKRINGSLQTENRALAGRLASCRSVNLPHKICFMADFKDILKW